MKWQSMNQSFVLNIMFKVSSLLSYDGPNLYLLYNQLFYWDQVLISLKSIPW